MTGERRHRPVTTIINGEARGVAFVHFYCPCGVTERLTICDVDICLPHRFTAALRAAHERDEWPPAPGDDEDLDVVGSFGVELEDLEAFDEVFG